jgi:dedicated sortase system histidine kinase
MHLSLRQKLFIVSLLLLVVPLLGIRYVRAIEDYLQQLILENLHSYTQSVAVSLIDEVSELPAFPTGQSWYASPLRLAPQIDGYDADWGDFSGQQLPLTSEQTKQQPATLQLGRYADDLYLFISVADDNIQYHQNSQSGSWYANADAMIIDIAGGPFTKRLVLLTEAPGVVYGRDIKTGQRETRVQGVWRERDMGSGYQVELKMPVSYAAAGFNIQLRDSDSGKVERFQLASETRAVLSAPRQLHQAMQQFALVKGRRLWLLDKEGRTLANIGSLETERNLQPVNPLFAWLLKPAMVEDPWLGQTRLEREDIQSALTGIAQTRRTRINDSGSILLSSAWPVITNGQVRAVVLVEESTAALQILQRSALASMLNISLVIFFVLMLALIGFAGRLSSRIRKLKKMTDQAIDDQGRVQGVLPEIKRGDELDDLSNHVRDMLIRLRAYHDYLEKLASRLAHEIRTPVAVVRSSLENMQAQSEQTGSDENLHRAYQGVERLQTLLHRMAEASRLEQSIQESDIEHFGMHEFLTRMVQGYRDIYPDFEFDLLVDDEEIQASGELLAQALDKLVSNATSFALHNTVIRIQARKEKDWEISVENLGPKLPEGMENQLFQSMVSIRDEQHRGNQPHLGLGLHIVQLIAEFHGGKVSAINMAEGVKFSISIPIQKS